MLDHNLACVVLATDLENDFVYGAGPPISAFSSQSRDLTVGKGAQD